MGGEAVGAGVPADPFADPDVVGRGKGVGVVQAACHDVDGARFIGVVVGERGAAKAAEAARHAGGGVELRRPALRDREAVGGEDREGERGCGGRPAAALAVAYTAGQRLALDAVADRSAQASAFLHAAILR